MFMETGMLGKPKESARKKLGLSPLPESGGDAMSRIMSADCAGSDSGADLASAAISGDEPTLSGDKEGAE
jgi:hypothetical protein